MGVPSDALTAGTGLLSDQCPYSGRDYREPSVIPTSGYVPPAGAPTEADAKAALLELSNREQLGYGGRWCSACHSDLSDPTPTMPLTPTGFKAATGREYTGREWPQGGHAADCPVPTLIRWCSGQESVFTRVRQT